MIIRAVLFIIPHMETDIVLLALRLLAGISLLAFLGTVAFFLQRDYRLTAEKVQGRKQPHGRLLVLSNETSTPQPGTWLPLLPSTTLGRAPGNTIQLDDRYASNEHARVVQRLGQWWLEDRHSSNGTHLNGVAVQEPVVLSSGDIISIGLVKFQLELD